MGEGGGALQEKFLSREGDRKGRRVDYLNEAKGNLRSGVPFFFTVVFFFFFFFAGRKKNRPRRKKGRLITG